MIKPLRALRVLTVHLLLLSACCQAIEDLAVTSASVAGGGAPAPSGAPTSVSSAVAATTANATASAEGTPTLPGRTAGCESGMVRVTGDYCPAVQQDCVTHHKEFDKATDETKKNVSERCLKYREPTRCLSKQRKPLDFCMDRYEYPNRVGELPRLLTSWHQAKKLCADDGKRLCTEGEFNFACEGPEMLPYVYGYERDPAICHIDEPYRYPDRSRQMKTYDACPDDPWCKAELERLDQREKIGERKTCVSWAGIYDLNGNVNEWVELLGEEPPNRSGLKGGWWGPVRGRCRPTVKFHKESDYGYEVGFRCCADVAQEKPVAPKP